MAGILKCDQVQSDSNLAFNIAGSNVAFMNATSLQMVGSNVSLAGTNVITNGKVVVSGMPTGAVLQVVQSTYSTPVTITGSTYTDTGLSATITPTSSTSKILVFVSQPYRHNSTSTGGAIIILRNTTQINQVVADATGPYTFYNGTMDIFINYATQFLDSPGTTSAITYKTQARPYLSAGSFYLQASGTVTNSQSVMTLMEIAG
jgi:hypothetical protein